MTGGVSGTLYSGRRLGPAVSRVAALERMDVHSRVYRLASRDVIMQTYPTYKNVAWAAFGLSGLLIVTTFVLLAGVGASVAAHLPAYWSLVALLLAFALGVAGSTILKLVESWQWEDVGREVGLTPAENGLPRDLSQNDSSWIGKDVLSGRVRGRPVHVRTYTRTTSSGGAESGGSKSVAFTLVEADLDEAVDGGVIANPASGGFTDSAEGPPDAHDGKLAAISDDETHAQALISGRAREALREMKEVGQLFVGDAEAVFRDAIPDYDLSDITGFHSGSSAVDRRVMSVVAGRGIDIDGDEKTVTHRSKDIVLDPDELERQIEAVVTVAEVYEDVRRDDSSA